MTDPGFFRCIRQFLNSSFDSNQTKSTRTKTRTGTTTTTTTAEDSVGEDCLPKYRAATYKYCVVGILYERMH